VPRNEKRNGILRKWATQGRTIVAIGGAAYKAEVDEEMTDAPSGLTHVNEAGEAHMVDVGDKDVTVREAEARGQVVMREETLALIRENAIAKGDVLAVARVAGVMAAKKTSELIPLCHGLALSSIDVYFDFRVGEAAIGITARARTAARTGVEMEALTAVTVSGLTIYDMCKGVDRGMRLTDVRLTYKSGGKSGLYSAE
jgi:cyclic pyranopterin phosphate synthase